MIQVKEALSLITQNSSRMPIRKIKVSKSLGFILAEDIYSPINMPPFRQSSMDGYAFSYTESKEYEVVSTSQAGDSSNVILDKNQAARIFTGAMIPDTADTVVMQEHVTVKGNSIEINKIPVKFDNVRNIGEQINEKELALSKNSVLNPAAVGFLTCLGITEVAVYAKPKVVVVVTGNELVEAGKPLSKGKIYESNSVMLQMCLEGIGIKKVKIIRVKDDLKATTEVVKKCLSEFDVVLVSGGISVGDYDFVKESLSSNGVSELFYKVNQKPGKPLFLGKKDNTIVFALPGNPASTLTTFYVYVYPSLKKMMGFETVHLPEIKRKINISFENSSGKSLFLKAVYDDKEVRVLDGQSSAMLNTFAIANGLIYLPHDCFSLEKNQEVIVLPLNN